MTPDEFANSEAGAAPRDRDGVRTYRGRTIEELIPRIRAELGPDAIILREREGLTGGIGGFFAQRCVEIDARAASRIDVYAGDLAEDEDDFPLQDGEEFADEVWEDVEEAPDLAAPTHAVPELPAPTAPAPAPAAFNEASFAARLEEATLGAAAEPPAAPPSPSAPMFIAFDELVEERGEPPAAAPTARPKPGPVEHEPEPVEPEPLPAPEFAPDPNAPWMAFAEQARAPEPEPRSISQAAPVSQASPLLAPAPTPVPGAEPPATSASPQPVAPPAPPTQATSPDPRALPFPGYGSHPHHRRRTGLLPMAERMLRTALEVTAAVNERRTTDAAAPVAAAPAPLPAAPAPVAAAPAPVAVQPSMAPEVTPPTAALLTQAPIVVPEPSAAAAVQQRLVVAGLSPRRAATIIASASARRDPGASEEELAGEIQAGVAAALPRLPALPRDHGAIAVVGAGGSGKTRVVGALARAHARAGIPVSVASFGASAGEEELGELLHGEDVTVIPSLRTRATARAVAAARERGLVILDTASASPGDESTIDVIAEALHLFSLDATLLALPATLNVTAALKLVDSFSAFDLTGVVATHVDETDGLGVVVELALQTGLPLTHTHRGLDLQGGLVPADPFRIAQTLL